MLREFNLFEAIGVIRQELRHSQVIAFLLDSHETHGLGDIVARRFLSEILSTTTESASRLLDIRLDDQSFRVSAVHREWPWSHGATRGFIDILMVCETSDGPVQVIIENKIGTTEHSDQLFSYWSAVERTYPRSQIIGLYATPNGDPPSDLRYVAVDYNLIALVIHDIAEAKSSVMHPAVHALMTQYAQMVRRQIVQDNPMIALSRKIYEEHRRALDFIFEHRPDPTLSLREVLVELVEHAMEFTDVVVNEREHALRIGFRSTSWNEIPALHRNMGRRNQGPIFFELYSPPGGPGRKPLELKLFVNATSKVTQERLDEVIEAEHALFRRESTFPDGSYAIFRRHLVERRDWGDLSGGERLTLLHQEWDRFVSSDLPQMLGALNAAFEDQVPTPESYDPGALS